MKLDDFEPLFGEPRVELSASAPNKGPLRPFLFRVHAIDSSHLQVQVTDFVSITLEAVRSVQMLEDMRYNLGIAGPWSEFVEYLINSIKWGDVKLVLEGLSKSDGPESARLIARKSKGMPLISLFLLRIFGPAANEAMASISFDLFKAFKSNHKLLVQEQEGRDLLTKRLAAEQEKSEDLQKQLDMLLYSKRHKSQNNNDKVTSGTSTTTTSLDVSDKQSGQNPSPLKASNRVVPAHRRSKVRGVLLQDTEDVADD